MKFYSANVVQAEDGSDDLLLEFSQEFLKDAKWEIGDGISFKVVEDSVILRNTSLETRTRLKEKKT